LARVLPYVKTNTNRYRRKLLLTWFKVRGRQSMAASQFRRKAYFVRFCWHYCAYLCEFCHVDWFLSRDL